MTKMFAAILLLFATSAFAANDANEEKKEKPLRFVPLITSTPLTGTGVGGRYAIQSKTGVDLRLDLVTTSEGEQSVYLALNQAF